MRRATFSLFLSIRNLKDFKTQNSSDLKFVTDVKCEFISVVCLGYNLPYIVVLFFDLASTLNNFNKSVITLIWLL